MKIRSIFVVVLAVLFVVISTPITYSCELAINPSLSEVVQNEKLEMIAYRRQIHKKCIINMDDIVLETTNCTIDQQSAWVKEGYVWSKKVTVSFPNVGEALVKLVYDCEKHPGDNIPFTARIKVVANTPKEEPPKEEPPKEQPSPPPQPNPPPQNPSPPKPENPPPSQPTVPTKPPDTPAPVKPQSVPQNNNAPIKQPQPTVNVPSVEPTVPNEISVGYVQQTTINSTPDPYPNPATTTQETVQKPPKPVKKVQDFFFDQSFFLIFMLLFLSLILYLLRLFKLRYFVNLLSLGILGFYLGGCICPIGMFERIGFLQAITPFGIFSLLFLLILFFISLFFGRIFCGWVCHQGALQEVLFHGKKSGKTHPVLQKVFTVLPILVLLTTLVVPFFVKTLVFCKVDPFKFAFQQSGSLLLLVLFVIIAILSVVYYRPFCRAFCPLGFFLGIGSWLGEKLHLRIFSTHLNCHTCPTCSVHCQVDALDTKVKGKQMIEPTTCIECGDCQTPCTIKKKQK